MAFPEEHRPLAEEAVLAPTLKTFSGIGISRPGLNEVDALITLEVSEEVRVARIRALEEVSTEKQSGRIQKKRKGGCDKLTLTLKQLKVKGNY
jgi:hypothetical protein